MASSQCCQWRSKISKTIDPPMLFYIDIGFYVDPSDRHDGTGPSLFLAESFGSSVRLSSGEEGDP